MKCSNCTNDAMFLVDPEGSKMPLCLDCNLKFVQVTALKNDMLEREINYLTGVAEAMTGLPGVMPKYPQREVVAVGSVTLNNIRIEGSTIGVLNTGTIGTVDAAVTALKQTGDADAATLFTRITEAVANDRQLPADAKNQVLELLSVLSTEATAPKERRRSAAMMPLLERLATLMSGAAALAQLWSQYGPLLRQLFAGVVGPG
jgi:hypothetical protein